MKRNRAITNIANTLKAFLIPVALYFLLLLLIRERIGNWNSIVTMLVLSVVPTITAYGVSFGFVSGIIDFSIGSLMILSGMCSVYAGWYWGLPGMIIVAIVTAVFLELIVGGLFAILKIPSLVVSMGALMIFEIVGVEFASRIGRIAPQISTGQYFKTPSYLTFLGSPPWNFVVLIIVAILYRIVYYQTKFATQARMVGSDELIAKNIGINPLKVKFMTFLVGGVFLGIAAMLSACYSSAVGSKRELASMSMVFKPLMAVIIGMSLERFVKMDVGIFIGSLCISIIFTGIIALGWPDSLQNVILGIFMLIVLAFPTLKKTIADSKRRRETRRSFEGHSAQETV